MHKKNEYRTGKCLNIPYYNCKNEFFTRYGVNDNNEALSLEELFKFVEPLQITPEQFNKITVAKPRNEDNDVWNQYPTLHSRIH
jgi:hypothetical protein